MANARTIGWFIMGAMLAASVILLTPLNHLSTNQAPLLAPTVTQALESGAVQTKPGAWSCTERSTTYGCGTASCFEQVNISCSGAEKPMVFNAVGSHARAYGIYPRNASTWVIAAQDDGTGAISITGYVLCCS